MIKKLLKKLFGGGGTEASSAKKPHAEEAAGRGAHGKRGERPDERRGAQRADHRGEHRGRAPAEEGRAGTQAEAAGEGGRRRRRSRGGRGRRRTGAAPEGGAATTAPAADAGRGAHAGRTGGHAATQERGRAQGGGQGAEDSGAAPPAAGAKRRRRRGGRGRGRVQGAPGAETAPGTVEAAAPEPPAPKAPPEVAPPASGTRAGRESHRPSRERREPRVDREAALEPIALPDLPPMPPWTPPQDPTRFDAYDLPEAVRAGLADAGFTECTPVQSQVLPLALAGKDVAAQSQTGTGKTAAFLVTIFSRLLWRGPVNGPKPRALVIAPTRELAVQIESDAKLLGAHTGLTVTAVFGGVDYDRQRQVLREGTDLVVGTPGRLIDYLKQGAWRPEGVELLVIDEADRMFDMGFIRDLRFILKRLPHYDRRQSMLFSATMSWRVMELTYEYMNIPADVRATPEKMTAERAVEELYHVAREEKPALLLGIMERERPERTMIFTNTKVEAEKVAKLLEHHGLRARGITGNLEQARRLRLMEEFKAGDLPIMVATDVASRGLHIEAVSHVVNWDLPQDPEDYVHRIGRTARAGAAGKAISLADESGALNLEAIEKLIGYKIPVVWHEHADLGEVKPGWREAAARERRERERAEEASGRRHRTGPAPGRGGGSGRRRR